MQEFRSTSRAFHRVRQSVGGRDAHDSDGARSVELIGSSTGSSRRDSARTQSNGEKPLWTYSRYSGVLQRRAPSSLDALPVLAQFSAQLLLGGTVQPVEGTVGDQQ